MFSPRRLAVAAGLVLALVFGSFGLPANVLTRSAEAATAPAPAPDYNWTPRAGVKFNWPDSGGKRAIQAHIIQAVRSTRPGRIIRMAMWNFDDKPARIELVRAHQRGVTVQMVVSAQVDNPNFTALKNALAKPSPMASRQPQKSFAKQCNAGCRTPPGKGIMHTKFYLFSRVGKAKNVSMFGSNNLTTAAGNRQWNDLITVNNQVGLFRSLNALFQQLRADKKVQPPFKTWWAGGGRYRVMAFPLNAGDEAGPIYRDLKKVHCRNVAPGYGVNGRTKIRIAIAGWFDEYGARIARRVRELWNQGCDVKIVNTLTGRGINQALRDPSGRGPVPNREVTRDRNYDGIPERYLHLKYFTVDGVYAGDRSARVVFTGSANWSARSARSDEIYFRVQNASGMVKAYANHVDKLFKSPYAHSPFTSYRTSIEGRPIIQPDGTVLTPESMLSPQEIYDPANADRVPDWFETD